jgi:hypothetical protein
MIEAFGLTTNTGVVTEQDKGRCAQARGSATPCNCWHEKDNKLREMGYKLSDACAMLQIKDLSLTAKYGLPLQRTDGAKLKRDDPKMITISHCPFCGAEYSPNNKRSDAPSVR